MRLRLASLAALSAFLLSGCVDVEFATGGSGGGSTTSGSTSGPGAGGSSTSSGSGGAASTTGTGGDATTTTTTTTTSSTTSTTTGGGGDCTNKRCGPDGAGGLCNGVDMQPMWSVNLPGEALAIVPWPETQSLFVSTANNHVLRIDQCDGSVMDDQPTVSALGTRPVIFGLGFDGAALTAIGANDAILDSPDRRFFLDTALTVTGNDTLTNEFGSTAGGAFADASGIWVNLKEGGQGFVPYGGAPECSQKYAGYGTTEARGITKTAAGVYALKWDNTMGRTTVIASLGSCASTCTCASPIDVDSNVGTIDNDVVDVGGGELVAVGASAMTDAHWARFNGTTLALTATLDYGLNMNGQDVLLTAAVSGGYIYAGGAWGLSAAEAYDLNPTGTAVVTRLPTSFSGSTVPTQFSWTGGARVRDVAVDATGLYAGGVRTVGSTGFLAKCTPALGCSPLP